MSNSLLLQYPEGTPDSRLKADLTNIKQGFCGASTPTIGLDSDDIPGVASFATSIGLTTNEKPPDNAGDNVLDDLPDFPDNPVDMGGIYNTPDNAQTIELQVGQWINLKPREGEPGAYDLGDVEIHFVFAQKGQTTLSDTQSTLLFSDPDEGEFVLKKYLTGNGQAYFEAVGEGSLNFRVVEEYSGRGRWERIYTINVTA